MREKVINSIQKSKFLHSILHKASSASNGPVTSSRTAVRYEPRKTIFANWSRTWLSRGSYGVCVAELRGHTGAHR